MQNMFQYEFKAYSKEETESTADFAKVVTLKALVRDGIMTYEQAEEWAQTHTIILKKKNVFRTLSRIWDDQKTEKNSYYWIMVHNPSLARTPEENNGLKPGELVLMKEEGKDDKTEEKKEKE